MAKILPLRLTDEGQPVPLDLEPVPGARGLRKDPVTGRFYYCADWLNDETEEPVVALVPTAESVSEPVDHEETYRREEIERANRLRRHFDLPELEYDPEAARHIRGQMEALRPPSETVPLKTMAGLEPTADQLLLYACQRILSPLRAAQRQYRVLAETFSSYNVGVAARARRRATKLQEFIDELET